MYLINKEENEIAKLESCSFTELGFREREHLQEWIAKQSDIFGEDILIIQKEFDGFSDTRERLDLLALDKDGNLIIIENKLDDSGKDVIWQALKYASYCSSLSKAQICSIYQDYLNRYCGGGDAKELLSEFYDNREYEELVLNQGNNQRLIFVAAKFRKEVTSTALWLMSHQLRIQCFKVAPNRLGEQLFLNVEQILPVKETEELMVGIAEKEQEQKASENELKSRHHLRRAYWEQLLESFNETSNTLYSNISPGKDHWLSAGSGVSSCPLSFIFNKGCARVELNINKKDQGLNKQIFDHLYAQKDKIESAFGAELVWKRLDHRKCSLIDFEAPFDCYDKENWPAIISWHQKTMIRFSEVLKPALNKVVKGI